MQLLLMKQNLSAYWINTSKIIELRSRTPVMCAVDSYSLFFHISFFSELQLFIIFGLLQLIEIWKTPSHAFLLLMTAILKF